MTIFYELKIYNKKVIHNTLSCRDHLCNLYGPTIISEDVKSNVVIRHIPESEDDFLVQNVNVHDRIPRNSIVGSYTAGGEIHETIIHRDHTDFGDTGNSPPAVPPRRDLKPLIRRKSLSFSHAITRPISSFFGSTTSESHRGSFNGSVASGSPSLYASSTLSPYTPSMKQKGFNFVLDPSPPAVMTRKQSRDEIAMVRNALKQNAYSRVSRCYLYFTTKVNIFSSKNIFSKV